MKYRDAKNLKVGDFIAHKEDHNKLYKIVSIEIFGQFKKVKVTVIENGSHVSFYNEELV